MSNSKLIELSYYDPSAQVRLSAYADTIVLDHNEKVSIPPEIEHLDRAN